MKCVNNEKREELGWQSPFYDGRKNNELVKCGVPESTGYPEIEKASKPTDKDMKNFMKQRSQSRKKAHVAMERLQKAQLNTSERNIGKHGDSYKIQYKYPISKHQTISWFSVDDIIDLWKQKQECKKVDYQRPLLAMIEEPYDAFEDQGFFITYNLPR